MKALALHFERAILDTTPAIRLPVRLTIAAKIRLTIGRLPIKPRLTKGPTISRVKELSIRLAKGLSISLAKELSIRLAIAMAMAMALVPSAVLAEEALGNIYYQQALKAELTDTDKAGQLYKSAIAEFDKTGTRGDVYAACMTNLARIEMQSKEFDRAEEHIKKSLDASHDHQIMATDYQMMGDIRAGQEKLSEAESNYSGAIEIFSKYGDPSRQQASVLIKLAAVYDRMGKATEASALRTRATDLSAVKTFNREATVAFGLGTKALVGNNYTEAIKLFEKALELQPDYNGAKMNLAICYQHEALECQHKGDHAEAERNYLRALPLMEIAFGQKHQYTCMVLQGLAETLESENKLDEAETYAKRWVDIERDTKKVTPQMENAFRAYYRILKGNKKDDLAAAIDKELTSDLQKDKQ